MGFQPIGHPHSALSSKNLVGGEKRLRMLYENKTRFKRAEDALRFYFRLRELLHSGRARRLVADELPMVACLTASDAIDDYQCIGWCMRGLGEIDLWLLSEVYGPTCFGVHRRTFPTPARRESLSSPTANSACGRSVRFTTTRSAL